MSPPPSPVTPRAERRLRIFDGGRAGPELHLLHHQQLQPPRVHYHHHHTEILHHCVLRGVVRPQDQRATVGVSCVRGMSLHDLYAHM